MKTQNIDNSSSEELNKTITWQFETANRLIAVISLLSDSFKASVSDFWDNYIDLISNIDTANDFGLAIIGQNIGMPRPIVKINNQSISISTDFYRKILKSRIILLNGNGSVKDYCEYVKSVFGENNVTVTDNLDMSLSFSIKAGNSLTDEQKAVLEQVPDSIFIYPAGVRTNEVNNGIIFGLDGQQDGTSADDYDVGTFGNATFIREGMQLV